MGVVKSFPAGGVSMLSCMTAEPMHIHGTFLPQEEPRDFWIVEGKLTGEPVAGARLCQYSWGPDPQYRAGVWDAWPSS